MNTKLYFHLLALTACILLMACTSTKLTKTWIDETYQGTSVNNVLIIGVTTEQDTRNLFEDTFAAQFRDAGIRAVPSAHVSPIPVDRKLDKETILAAVAKYKNDAVIITYLTGVETKESYTPPGRFYSGYSRGYHNTFDPRVLPEVYREKVNIHLETTLYDVKTESPIWSAESQSLDPKTDMVLFNELVKLIVKDLQVKKILPK